MTFINSRSVRGSIAFITGGASGMGAATARLFAAEGAHVAVIDRDAAGLDAVLADIAARDARDSGRSTAPLRRADDAALLDTTELGIDAAVQRAIALVEAAIARGGPQQV